MMEDIAFIVVGVGIAAVIVIAYLFKLLLDNWNKM